MALSILNGQSVWVAGACLWHERIIGVHHAARSHNPISSHGLKKRLLEETRMRPRTTRPLTMKHLEADFPLRVPPQDNLHDLGNGAHAHTHIVEEGRPQIRG